jgi:hypothetical protein
VRRWILIAAAVATAATALAATAGAQSAPELSQGTAVVAESSQPPELATIEVTRASVSPTGMVGPRFAEGFVAYKPSVTAQREALLLDEREMKRPASRNNAALIVVGLSAMVLGSIVDDDAGSVLVLGGAGVTLYGLWQYLK